MIGLLVVTHGGVAEELLAATRRIVSRPINIAALSIDWDQDVDDVRARIESEIEALDRGRGVIIATDMFGGTPTNIALTFYEPGRIEIVTGVNLPMVIKFTNLAEEATIVDAAQQIASRGRNAIGVAGEILSKPARGAES